MYHVFTVLIIIDCILLILIVLVQNSKGGGLAAGFTSSNQYMGVRKTADFLEKATWTLASALLVLCVISTMSLHSTSEEKKSLIENQIKNSSTANPAVPFSQGQNGNAKNAQSASKKSPAPLAIPGGNENPKKK